MRRGCAYVYIVIYNHPNLSYTHYTFAIITKWMRRRKIGYAEGGGQVVGVVEAKTQDTRLYHIGSVIDEGYNTVYHLFDAMGECAGRLIV